MLKNFKFIFASFLFVMTVCTVGFTSFAAQEQPVEDTSVVTKVEEHSIGQGLGYLAAALAIAVGSLGAGHAVAASVPAALGTFSEDKSTFGKILILVALGEGISIFSFVISMVIALALGK